LSSADTWREHAACRRVPVEIFFPAVEHEAEEAKAVCRSCTVQEACLEFSFDANERFGVWGGLTSQERRTLAARRRKAKSAGAPLPETLH
jgi:WhiB family redox-sensing transcriptional regulator